MRAISVIILLFNIYLIITVILLLLENRETSSTFAWIFIFILFPVGGFILYLLIGRNWRNKPPKKQLIQQLVEQKLLKLINPIMEYQEKKTQELLKKWKNSYKIKLLNLLYKSSNSVITSNNLVQLLFNGKEKFDNLLNDLKEAKHFIHMEYYIWRSDSLTQKIKKILIDKAKQGVEIRILYDAIGSIFLKRKYKKMLRKAGIKIYPYFNFLSPVTFHTLNYRNHRKIVIIDGQIGYTGGMNMAKEYIDGGKRFSFWSDIHLRITGHSVSVLEGIFATSWYNTTREELFEEKYFPNNFEIENELPIQVTTSGPDSEWESIKQLYFVLITSAEKKVYIQTPYFVPDSSIYMALKTAALSGIDVRIIVTGVPDKKIPFWSAFTFYKNLLKAGVRVFHYKRGFMHAKSILIDNEICSIGTANMDIRSFHLNYEVNVLIYDKKISLQLKDEFLNNLNYCTELTLDMYNNFTHFEKLRNSFARLLAPLL